MPILALIAILALLAAGSLARAEPEQKVPPIKGRAATAPARTFHGMSDVAEAEPNGSPAQAQSLGCASSFRPGSLANVSAVPDSDWISFTAGAGDLLTIETAEDVPGQLPTDTVLNLFASDGVTSLASNDDGPGLFLFSRITDFSAPYTGLYYARIRGFNAAEGPYRANISCAAPAGPPTNDQCAGGPAIAYGHIKLAGTTRFATNDYDLCPGQETCPASCTGLSSPGKDVVYRLEIAEAGHEIALSYHLEPASTDASLYIVTDCGDVQASCIAGRDTDLGTPREILNHTFAAPGTYYLILDAFTAGGASWTMTGCLGCLTTARAMSWGRLKTIYR